MKLNVTCRTQACCSLTALRSTAIAEHRRRIASHRIASHIPFRSQLRSQAPASQAAVCGHSAFSCEHMSDAQPMDWPINCVDRKGSGATAHVAGACEAREEEQARVDRVVACVKQQTRATLTVDTLVAANTAAENRCGESNQAVRWPARREGSMKGSARRKRCAMRHTQGSARHVRGAVVTACVTY
jgi:hypothetical protein